ncbi:MAG: PBSX family phage terminase large subunit [Candidatus Peregrinibacteria bacterium]
MKPRGRPRKVQKIDGFIPVMEVTPVYIKNYKSKKRITINRGGTRSGKTYSISQYAVNWLFTGEWMEGEAPMESGVFRIIRKYGATLKGTVMADILSVLTSTPVDIENTNGESLYSRVHHNKSDRIIEYGARKIIFSGIDDIQKARGMKQDILYPNEANEITYNEFHQLNFRTKYKVIIDFNPDDEQVWINKELEMKRAVEKGDVDVIVSTYRDNPFLSDTEVEEIEYLQKVDKQLWEVFGNGNYGKITGLVFQNITVVDEMPENAKLLGYGLDFGFTNDPSPFIRVAMNSDGIFLDEVFYEYGLTNSDIAEKMKEKFVSRSAEIIADSAEPKSIEELFRMGWNVHAVRKGADSINYGISVMKQKPIHVTARSINLRKEFQRYKWKTDKEGNTINEPIDAFNHCIDAARYVCMMKIGLSVWNAKYERPKDKDRENTSGMVTAGLRNRTF